jgi:lysozyme
MNTSEAGKDLIKRFEGVRLNAYLDSVKVPTIGVGHTKGVRMGDIISPAQVDEFLTADLMDAERAIDRCVTVPLNQAQFDALVSWTFNLGGGALSKSTLLKRLNASDYDGAADEMLKWTMAGNRVLDGLVKRRTAERMLFLTGAA